MNNKLVSIIIPIFNTEKYISKCLDSLIHTYSKNQKDTLIAINNIISFSKKINKYESNKEELNCLFIAHVLEIYLSRFVLSGKNFNEFKNKYIKLNNTFSD